ncbi:hypothetical protein GGX14DRAFT_558715 [Mycena pura]|uniref:UvrD-like helicase ATP-binding domain-containing protein n=1 Tax=Mycena pura TaxID=153505 RepID=A0AAD7E0L0_9AGAR|nr:hypothetical protein GGX14DRAFT_558715 [Mycena pura]
MSQRHYPPDIFDGLASSDSDVERILDKFEDLLFDNRDEAIYKLNDLVSYERPEVGLIIQTGIDPAWVLNRFPATVEAFNESHAQTLLSQLSAYFLYKPTSVIDLRDEERQVDERPDKRRGLYRQLVKDAPSTLVALKSKLSQSSPVPSTVTKMSQKQMKQARRAAIRANAPLDPAPFERLGMEVPETCEEAEEAINTILRSQKEFMMDYLDALAAPELEDSLVAACVLDQPVSPSLPQMEGQEEDASRLSRATVTSNAESLYPVTQPMKLFDMTLYSDSAAGFGEWAINISPRGERDLRDHSRRDRKIFKIILKKIQELSNGHFSPDNQKRLNHEQVDIPIFEAKMTRDLRLVYQIDCVPSYDSLSERQAIKIFGVYTHAQMGRVSFWDSIGRELGKKGKEYKDRCAFRQRPHHAGDNVFSPRIYPAPVEVRTTPSGCAPDLPPDDLEQIQSLLLKSVHFSQPLLNAILADSNVAFILQVSPREQAIIEHPHSCYVLGRSGTGKTTTMLYKMLLVEANYELSKRKDRIETLKPRQLFVTQSRILAEKVQEHFMKLLAGYQVAPKSDKAEKMKMTTTTLVDSDDDPNWHNDLPGRYSDLRAEHFPLFLTFDRLCLMLENDIKNSEVAGSISATRSSIAMDSVQKATRLTYERFLQHYWPHFSQTLTKGLDSAMIYSEFMGVIMGSEETLSGASSYLNRDTYLNLSDRAQSTFADQRERIYTLFESYVSQKRSLEDIDAADRTHAILRYLDQRGVPGKKIDYLYVDETQDNLLIDTLLLRSICHNGNGLFWAGDTAQTISVGSSFRFNELKAFLFRIEERRLATKTGANLYHQPVLQPQTFQLTVNYRSHAGIVNCAHTVIELITKFWPYAIDVLDRERGTVDGLRPVFFTGFDSGNVEYEQFLFGDREGSYIEFGAQQCILVRDEAAREKLREQVGDIGLIMTLYESKGLEFNDVLLYNFFEDSTVSEAQWRVVLNAVDTGRRKASAPVFDKVRHAGVCVDLKFLYVAITRARNNVWIADTSSKGEPMRMVWTSKEQIQTCTPGTDTPRLAMSSTAAECFEDAGDDLQAAQIYREAREFTKSTELYRKLGNFDEAVDNIKNHEQEIQLEVLASVTNVARLFYFKEHELEKASALFSSYEEELEYLEDRGLDVARVAILESLGRYSDAAEVHLEEGRIFEAIKLFLRDRNNELLMRRGIECILQGLWQRVSFAVTPGDDDSSASVLLSLAAKADVSLLSENYRNELTMFQAICQRDLSKLEALGQLLEEENPGAALLCLDHCFTSPPKIQALSVDGVAQQLRAFFRYVKLLNTFTWADPSTNSVVKRLFGYVRQGENSFSIPEGTFLHKILCQQNHPACRRSVEGRVVLDSSELRDVFHQTLKDRLRHRVLQENDTCKRTKAFSPCLTFSVFEGNCNRVDCPHEHIAAALINVQHYNSRVRIHLLQILILQTVVQYIDNDPNARQYWVSRLYTTLYPPYFRLGSASGLDLGLIPEAEPAFQVLKHWVRSWAYEFQFTPHTKFLSNLSQIVRLSFRFDPKDAMSYLTQSPFISIQPAIYHRQGGSYIVAEFLSFLHGKAPESISAGVLFVRHIIISQLPINISVLCDVIEHLCACIVVADRQQRWVIHDMTLPLSWLVNWTSIVGEGPRHTNLFILLMQCLATLLERLYSGSGADHLLFESKNLATLGVRIRDTFLARICRCICLMGYNSKVEHTRYKIFKTITFIRGTYPSLSPRYLSLSNKYFTANGWTGLVRALWDSTTGSALDELVVLLHAERPRLNSARNVRQIVYQSLEDIPLLLGSSRSIPENPPAQGADVSVGEGETAIPENIPAPGADVPVDEGEAAMPENTLAPGPDVSVGEGETAPLDEDDGEGESGFANTDGGASDEALPDAGPVAMPPALEAVQRTEEEIRAVSKIQRAFSRAHRRVGRRKAELAKSSLTAGCAHFFSLCLKEVAHMGSTWSSQEYSYRLRFLGPLPHLLLCLDVVHTATQTQKTQVKKDLREAKHERLEVLDTQLTQLTDTLKQVIRMQKELGPTAAVHVSHDLASLKSQVSKSVELLQNLPFKTPEGLSQHLERAYKGIVQPQVFKPASTKMKPALNTEDLDY